MTVLLEELSERQKQLNLKFSDYNLANAWSSSVLIDSIRQNLGRFMPKGLYDPQDLEHQVLFRLTTYDPSTITDRLIEEVVDEQYTIIKERLGKIDIKKLESLLRGLSGKWADLNCYTRLELQRDEREHLVAVGGGCSFKVEFRKIEDKSIIELFTEQLHYVHQKRDGGGAFGFFYEGDEMPWAVETTEPSTDIKEYKRNALLAHGIHPDRAIELTRFYTLPGSPRNAISVVDKEVSVYYQPFGIEALITTTMPAYAKTKGSTIAGGLNRALLIKDLKHYFVPRMINRRICYENVTRDYLNANPQEKDKCIESRPEFPLLPVVEVFKQINRFSFEPLAELKTKTIYVQDRDRN